MKLAITHETQYDYQTPVETAQHLLYLSPRPSQHQRLITHRIDVCPEPSQQRNSVDVFGNTRLFLSLQAPHRQLRVVASSEVETVPCSLSDNPVAWDVARDLFRYQAGSVFQPACEFCFASPMAPIDPAFASYARASFPQGQSLQVGALDLMHRIHADFCYETRSTEVNTPVLDAFNQRKGVCQDFAHVLVACLRSMGLAARYISGYLLTAPPPGQVKLRGSDASHAWASVYLPAVTDGDHSAAACWVDLDPTNDRAGSPSPGEDYVTLAVGRDFADVSPMRGVIQGGTHHTLQVGVTVEPVPPAAV